MRRAALRSAALAVALSAGAAPGALAQEDPFAGLEPLDVDAFVARFAEICLDGLPDFAGVRSALDADGFGAPDAAGFRLHGERAVAAMALTPAEAPPQGAPVCMVMASRVPFEAAEAALGHRLEARFGPLESATADILDLPHRVWIWNDDAGAAEFVLTRDGKGHLGALVALPPAGDGS